MNLSLIYSGRVRKALYLAEKKHRGVNRKSGDVPYILHPVICATIGAAVGADDDMLCALLLHDTVEDTDTTLMQIVDEFGVAVASFVAGLTKDESLHGAVQKRAIIDLMRDAEIKLVVCKGVDVAANATDVVFEVRERGIEKLNEIFKKPALTLGHYVELMHVIIDRLDTEYSTPYPLLSTILKERLQEMEKIKEEFAQTL